MLEREILHLSSSNLRVATFPSELERWTLALCKHNKAYANQGDNGTGKSQCQLYISCPDSYKRTIRATSTSDFSEF